MPKFKDITELTEFRKKLQASGQVNTEKEPVITIGMGTCGIAAGASDTLGTIERELKKQDIKATIRTVGCIGMCVNEPLVDVQVRGEPRVTYININSAKAIRLIEEHIVQGQIVQDLALGYVPKEWQ
jgi:NADP-reducing hydrogenase subunit HndB